MIDQGVLDPPSRRIPLDGPVNFRALGGYPTEEGRSVRWRSVFRADGLDSMTVGDVETVVGELDVQTVIDLRTEREIGLTGIGPVTATAIEWHNFSIIDETRRAWQEALDNGNIVEQYFVMLEGSSAKFVAALEIIAGTDQGLVFHCAAGKDRTGLLAGLLLAVLGVSDDLIAHDYGLTAEVMPALFDRFVRRAQDPRYQERYADKPAWKATARKGMTADPATILQVFTGLRGRSGTPEEWLVEHGLDRSTANRLRTRLLV